MPILHGSRLLPVGFAVLWSLLPVSLTAGKKASAPQFWIDPPLGRAAGGELVTIHVSADTDLTRARVAFGGSAVEIQKLHPEEGTWQVTTPVYDSSGQPTGRGFFRQKVVIKLQGESSLKRGPDFIYFAESAAGTTPRGGGALPTANQVLTLQPAYGSPAGGRDVGIVVPSLRDASPAQCSDMLVFFDDSLAKVVNGSKAGVVHVLVPRISLSDGEVKLVTVTLRCSGTVVGQGAFVYYDPPRQSERDRDRFPVVLVTGVWLALAAQTWWIMGRLKRSPLRDEHQRGPSAEIKELKAAVDNTKNVMEKCLGSVDRLQGDLAQAVQTVVQRYGSPPPSANSPSQGPAREVQSTSSRSGTAEGGTDGWPKLDINSRRDLEERERKPSMAKEGSRRNVSDPSNVLGAQRLADIWNDASGSGHTTEQLLASLSASWPEKVVARHQGGLVVVTANDQNASWVLPPINPLLHESTIQEFFEIRASRGAGEEASRTRLIRPASVPKGTDPHGFTAGLITRGLIEA